jgi:hypothetical protein
MNDASEYIYANQIIQEVTRAYATSHPGLERYQRVYQLNSPDLGVDVYAACFCEDGDLLSQWRSYARQGAGYAIEFSWAKLREKFALNRLGKVEYAEDAQKNVLNQILNSLAHNVSSVEPDLDARHASIAGGLANALITVRAFLKSPTFREEKEWRVIAFHGTDTREELYRQSNNILVPYCALPLGNLDELPITKIVIGPSLHPKAAQYSLRRFLDSSGLARVAIEVSPIPIRV